MREYNVIIKVVSAVIHKHPPPTHDNFVLVVIQSLFNLKVDRDLYSIYGSYFQTSNKVPLFNLLIKALTIIYI